MPWLKNSLQPADNLDHANTQLETALLLSWAGFHPAKVLRDEELKLTSQYTRTILRGLGAGRASNPFFIASREIFHGDPRLDAP
jgi:hypothetical protein